MELTKTVKIENGIIDINLKATDVDEDLIECLGDYNRILRYSEIDFKDYIAVTNGKPSIVDSSTEGAQLVELKLVPKNIPINENLDISFKFIVDSVSESELVGCLDTKELVAKAKSLIFITKIENKLKEIVDLARQEHDTDFEGVTVTVI